MAVQAVGRVELAIIAKKREISESRKTPSKPDDKTDKKNDENGNENGNEGNDKEEGAKAESSPADPIDASGVTPRRGGSPMAPVDSSSALHEKIDDQSDEKVNEKSNKNKGKTKKKTNEEIEDGDDSAAHLIYTLNHVKLDPAAPARLGDEVFQLLCKLRTAGKYTSEEMLRCGRSTCLP